MFLLIRNDWLQLVRAVQQQPIRAVSYLFTVLFLFNVYMAGISFSTLLQHNTILIHATQSVSFLAKAIAYWAWLDFLMRILLQPLTGLNIEKYKCLPFSIAILINFIFYKNLTNLYSIYPFLLLFSFAKFIGTHIGVIFLAVCLIIILNTSLVFFIKSRAASIWLSSLLIFLNIYLFSSNFLSINILIKFLLQEALFIGVFIGCSIICLYILNYRWTKRNLYMDAFISKSSNLSKISFTYFTKKLQFVWSLVDLDIKLIVRNRRPRQYFLANTTIAVVCTILLSDDFFSQPIAVFHFTLASILGGFVMMSHQQLMFGWEGSYFDGLLARPFSIKELLQAKRILFVINCLLVYSVWLLFV